MSARPLPWIKVWREKLRTSRGYQSLDHRCKGIYLDLMLLADGDGALRYRGRPLRLKEIADEIGLRTWRPDRVKRALQALRDAGLIRHGEDGAVVLCRFRELQERPGAEEPGLGPLFGDFGYDELNRQGGRRRAL